MDKTKRTIKKAVGEILKEKRHSRFEKITQESMAQLIGISQEQYSRIENGKGRLSIFELYVICNRLGVTLTEFVFNMENRLLNYGVLTPERKKDFKKWLDIYMEYHKDSYIKNDAGKKLKEGASV